MRSADASLLDLEVVNAFGSDLKSATVRLADIPAEAVLPVETPITNSSATVLGSAVAVSSRPLTVSQSGGYLVVLSNSLGKSITNRVALDSGGQAVSARDHRLRVRTSDRLESPSAQWLDSGLKTEVPPAGTVRIPVSLDPARATGFFRLVEE